jgi:hypothetical protein
MLLLVNLLLLVFYSCDAAIYTFDGVTIEMQIVSTGPVITFNGETKPCGRMVFRNSLYHASKSGVLTIADRGALNTNGSHINLTTGSEVLSSYDVNELEDRLIAFISVATPNGRTYSINSKHALSFYNSFTNTPEPSLGVLSGTNIYILCP